MKRCEALRLTSWGVSGPEHLSRRWASYDRASLAKDVLLGKVEAGLGEDVDGKPLKIDADAKTVKTAAGDLPISPLMDPAWMQARRRATKAEPGMATGRFRSKLANNPFARALATPMRKCPNTSVVIPRYFLQDFEMVKHPETGQAWWAPGPLSFEFLQPTKLSDDTGPNTGSTRESAPGEEETDEKKGTSTSEEPRPRRAPVTGYTLSRKTVVDAVGGPSAKFLHLLTAMRTGMALGPETKDAVWRKDMGDLLLRMMRQQAVDALIARANKEHEPRDRFIQACANWGDIKDVKLRGCILWMPGEADTAGRYATYDVEGVKYGQKMAVHNLCWLLGEAEAKRLRETADVFRDNEIVVLKQWPSISSMRLHMLLWRLQGFLPASSSDAARSSIVKPSM